MAAAVSETTSLEDLRKRIAQLEAAAFRVPKHIEVVDEPMRRARSAVQAAGLYSAQWKFVPETYYSWGLEERRRVLNNTPSILQLCKSLLLENKKYDPQSDPNPRTNPQFVLVIVQYAATLDTTKLTSSIRKLQKDLKLRLDANAFDWRIAATADNDRITGYAHNSVSPFGLLDTSNLLMVLAEAIEGFFWMGGGHEHLKLGLSKTDFCRALHPLVADISQPRLDATAVVED